MPFQRLQYQNITLKPITSNFDNNSFISSLFKFDDVKREYTLRDDHAADHRSFVKFMADGNENGTGIYCIIENNYSSPVGFITAEPYRDNMSGELGWNVGVAIHPAHRNQGHAKNSIQALQDFLSNYTIKTMVLDIGLNNAPARSVAEACGFEQRKSPTGGLGGYYDQQHPEVGMRTQWIKNIHEADPRADAFRKAVDAYRAKNYQEAIKLYYEAVEEPFKEGSPFTDAQIYSNLGMAYSSTGEYKKAYKYLTMAWNMGCQNPSVSRELQWLRNNAADVI